MNPVDKSQLKTKALELKNEGHTNVKIVQELGVTEGAVRKWLKQLELEE